MNESANMVKTCNEWSEYQCSQWNSRKMQDCDKVHTDDIRAQLQKVTEQPLSLIFKITAKGNKKFCLRTLQDQ